VAVGGGSEEMRFVKFGLVVYALVGLGLFVANVFLLLLADDDSLIWGGIGEFAGELQDEELFIAALTTYNEFLTFVPLIAILIGVYFYQTETTLEMPAKAAAIATAVGVIAVGFLLVLLAVIFEPDGIDISLGDEIAGLLGILIGSVAVAAATGFLLENDPLDIF